MPLAHRKIKTSDNAKHRFPRLQAQGAAGGIREAAFPRAESVCLDAGVDHVEAAGIHGTRGALMAFRHRGGGVAVTLEENLRHKAGHGDHGIRAGEKMFPAERGAWAFRQVAGENHQGPGLNEVRRQEGRPIVIPMMGVHNAGAGTPKNSGQSQDLPRAEFRKRTQGRSFPGQGGGLRSGRFDRPTQFRQALGQRQALGVGPASAQTGVQHDDAGGEGGGGHVVSLR